MIFVLENIRSSWNVGAIFRTADALGAELVLVGYTPRPTTATQKQIHKTALGAEENVHWRYFEHSVEAMEALAGGLNISVEINNQSRNIFEFIKIEKPLENINLWFGNEIHGVSEEVQAASDYVLHLPMWGQKESLNVASTVCTIGYLMRYWQG